MVRNIFMCCRENMCNRYHTKQANIPNIKIIFKMEEKQK